MFVFANGLGKPLELHGEPISIKSSRPAHCAWLSIHSFPITMQEAELYSLCASDGLFRGKSWCNQLEPRNSVSSASIVLSIDGGEMFLSAISTASTHS